MTLLKITLFCVFGVMQCFYADVTSFKFLELSGLGENGEATFRCVYTYARMLVGEVKSKILPKLY